MIQKTIRVWTTPGNIDEFLVRQELWNACMSNQPGFVSVSVCKHLETQNLVQIDVRFQSIKDLHTFMSEQHDLLEESTGISELFDKIETEVFEVKRPGRRIPKRQ